MVHAGTLIGKALYNPKPEYPKKAKEAGISGKVEVAVAINERGEVACVQVITGHPLLQEAVKKVVCDTRFKPLKLNNKPFVFAGILTYNFVL